MPTLTVEFPPGVLVTDLAPIMKAAAQMATTHGWDMSGSCLRVVFTPMHVPQEPGKVVMFRQARAYLHPEQFP